VSELVPHWVEKQVVVDSDSDLQLHLLGVFCLQPSVQLKMSRLQPLPEALADIGLDVQHSYKYIVRKYRR
jgi:hypothetical protein